MSASLLAIAIQELGGKAISLVGHQLGMMIAAVGWLFRGNVIVAIAHLLWVAFASVWFGFDPVVRKRRS